MIYDETVLCPVNRSGEKCNISTCGLLPNSTRYGFTSFRRPRCLGLRIIKKLWLSEVSCLACKVAQGIPNTCSRVHYSNRQRLSGHH